MLIICDVDGVLADCTHRLPLAQAKDYDKFYSKEEVLKDPLIYAGYELVMTFIDAEAEVCFVSSRSECCRKATAEWLRREDLITSQGFLAMRDEHDYRPSPVIKVELIKELYDTLTEQTKNTLRAQDMYSTYFIDDDPENVKAVCTAFPEITGITFGIKRMITG